MTVKRSSQVGIESLSTTSPKARASQVGINTLSTTTPTLRASQSAVEVISNNVLKLQTSQIGVEVLSVNSVAYSLPAAVGSLALAGQSSRIAKTGHVAHIPKDKKLKKHSRSAASFGNYIRSGQDAALGITRSMAALVGAFALTGEDAGLTAHRRLQAEAGEFSLDGQPGALTSGFRLAPESGMFALEGQPAYFVYVPSVVQVAIAVGRLERRALKHYRLTARGGVFLFTGFSATLRTRRLLRAMADGYAFSDGRARLLMQRRLAIQSSPFELGGQGSGYDIGLGPDLQAALLAISF